MPTIEKYQKYINKARETEKKYNIPTNALVGLLSNESNFNPNAISKAKAKGIAQFMDSTAKEYRIDPYNTDQAIDAAGKYLQSSYKQLGNWDEAILSYNAGVGRVKEYKAGKPITIKEHQDYVGRVREKMIKYGSVPTTKTQSEDYINPQPPQENYTQQTQYLPTQQRQDVAPLETEDKVDLEADTQKLQEHYNEKEKLFLKDYNTLFADNQEEIPQEEQQQQEQPKVNYSDIYNQVSNFVDTPMAQTGGQYTQNEIDFLSEIAIKDNNGQWKNPGKITQISSPNITMRGVKQALIGISLQTGEEKKMLPNKDYFFKDTKDVLEVPIKSSQQLTKQEINFLKELNQQPI